MSNNKEANNRNDDMKSGVKETLQTQMNERADWKSYSNQHELREKYLASLSPIQREMEEEINAHANVFKTIAQRSHRGENGKVWSLEFQLSGKQATRIKIVGPRGGEKAITNTHYYKSVSLELWENFDPTNPSFSLL